MPILTRRSLLFAPAVVAAASLMPVRLWRLPVKIAVPHMAPGIFWYAVEDIIADIHGRPIMWPHHDPR